MSTTTLSMKMIRKVWWGEVRWWDYIMLKTMVGYRKREFKKKKEQEEAFEEEKFHFVKLVSSAGALALYKEFKFWICIWYIYVAYFICSMLAHSNTYTCTYNTSKYISFSSKVFLSFLHFDLIPNNCFFSPLITHSDDVNIFAHNTTEHTT